MYSTRFALIWSSVMGVRSAALMAEVSMRTSSLWKPTAAKVVPYLAASPFNSAVVALGDSATARPSRAFASGAITSRGEVLPNPLGWLYSFSAGEASARAVGGFGASG